MAVPGELARAYRGRVIFGPFAPVHPEEVSALEGEIGCPIPPAYRSFLEVANGGTLVYSVRVPPGSDGEPISFCGLSRLGASSSATTAGEPCWGSIGNCRTAAWPNSCP